MQPNKIDFSQVQVSFQTINDPYDVLVLVAVLLVNLFYLMSFIFARRADKKDLEKVNLEDQLQHLYPEMHAKIARGLAEI